MDHTTEDVGIVLGLIMREALGERRGVERFGHMTVPLDEALVAATIDLSGHPYMVYDIQPPAAMLAAGHRTRSRIFWHIFHNSRCCIPANSPAQHPPHRRSRLQSLRPRPTHAIHKPATTNCRRRRGFGLKVSEIFAYTGTRL